ncbi:GNAT family N-acetyltransferase [Paenibacillus sp. CCS19]|uniref:GNAT family N-acetyltransferase n=1 Tax=Paenibacillus sp. CCS19 TaxID=3158387 RepID=UPI00295EBEDB|nr:GNAT family N-acetyltransferase [Paenibacillus cellulosilyticus]
MTTYETHFNPLAIYHEDEMVGFAIYCVNETGIGEIEAIMIDQHHQGKGYGRSAMVELIKLLRDQFRCQEVRLSHRKENEIASNLYESLDFEIINSEEAIARRLVL